MNLLWGDSINKFWAILIISVYVVNMINLTDTTALRETSYSVDKCKTSEDCADSCSKSANWHPRCDLNGTCVCDCSQNSAPQTPAKVCDGWIESFGHDTCSTYCNRMYFRPSDLCGIPGKYVYCVCTCPP